MSDDGSIGCWYCEASHYSSHRCNDDGIYYDKILEVSLRNRGRGHKSLETSNSSSMYHRCYNSSDIVRSVYMSQDNNHYLYCNRGVHNFGVAGRGVTESQ